jgi:Fe-S cluster assembly protein SufD
MSNGLTTNILHQAPEALQEPWRFTPVKQLADFFTGDYQCGNLNLTWQNPNSNLTLTTEKIESISNSIDQSTQIVRERCLETAVLTFPRNFESSENIVIARQFKPGVNVSRLRIVVQENSHFTLVIDNQGIADLVEEIEVIVGPGSNLKFISLQQWAPTSRHLGRIHAKVERDARLVSDVISIGGKIIRLLPTVEFGGPGAEAELNGLYFANDGAHSEHRIHVDHGVPEAKSRVHYKGALSGESSHSVWFGDVYIRANAVNTDTYELNRNLILTEGARADSVPNLEIETGDIVGAGHASTTGRFDDDQLFYLMSRGIDSATARKLVLRGYFAEIIDKLGVPELQERITQVLETELEKVDR